MMNIDEPATGPQRTPLHKNRENKVMRPDNQVTSVDEDQIQESIDNLDMLLANLRTGKDQNKQQALTKLGK